MNLHGVLGLLKLFFTQSFTRCCDRFRRFTLPGENIDSFSTRVFGIPTNLHKGVRQNYNQNSSFNTKLDYTRQGSASGEFSFSFLQ